MSPRYSASAPGAESRLGPRDSRVAPAIDKSPTHVLGGDMVVRSHSASTLIRHTRPSTDKHRKTRGELLLSCDCERLPGDPNDTPAFARRGHSRTRATGKYIVIPFDDVPASVPAARGFGRVRRSWPGGWLRALLQRGEPLCGFKVGLSVWVFCWRWRLWGCWG
jgi:hypothetical protein